MPKKMDYGKIARTIISRRNRELKELRLEHPEYSLSRIAEEFNITEERVRQILKKMRLDTRNISYIHYCSECGKEIPHGFVKSYQNDGEKIFLCKTCYNTVYPKIISEREKKHYITVECDYCSSPLKRMRSLWKHSIKRGYRHNFCNRICWGKWRGENYGFKAHPENIREKKLITIRYTT